MSVASAIEQMVAEGFTPEQAIKAAKIMEAHFAPPMIELSRSLRADRQARWRANSRRKTSTEASTKRLQPDADVVDAKRLQTSTKRLQTSTPLARVEDNLLPLETAGGFQEEGRVSSSLRSEETLVPDPKSKTPRKERVELLQTVVGMWNELAGANRLVAVRDITPTRQAAIVARSDDLVKTYDFPDALAGWRRLMGLVRGSPFLRGELNGFRCDFDFVTRASSFTKIMEGKYEARPAPSRR